MQLKRRASIFACDRAVVISTKKVLLGTLDDEPVLTWVNSMQDAEMGTRGSKGSTTNSFLNTNTFIVAWDTLMQSGQVESFDFVAKVDPDVIFMPARLKEHVQPLWGEAVFFTNCGKYGGEVLLYGSVEVISVPAFMIYSANVDRCKSLDWYGWGEDTYLQRCLGSLGVKAVPDLLQVADKRCLDAPCSDYTKVAFHDYKTPGRWLRCWRIAVGKAHVMTDLVPRKLLNGAL